MLISSCSKTQEDFDVTAQAVSEITTELLSESNFTEAVGLSNRSAFSKMQVLEMYRRAVDEVKLRCPGFVRTIDNEIYETTVGENASTFLNKAISILIGDNSSSDSVVAVDRGDDLACRMYFPVYDTDYGCKIYDGAAIKDAMCYDNGKTYDIIILFYEQSTESGISQEFTQMMTPFSQETLIRNLNAYFPALNAENCEAALRYYNCEIHCTIDKNSGHVLALSQKMVTQVKMQIKLDMVLAESSFSAQATMINHLVFNDFIWK